MYIIQSYLNSVNRVKYTYKLNRERILKYVDYDLDISKDRIILDAELNIDKLGWKAGDCFVVQNINGRAMLKKVDPLVQFIKTGTSSGAINGFSKISS